MYMKNFSINKIWAAKEQRAEDNFLESVGEGIPSTDFTYVKNSGP